MTTAVNYFNLDLPNRPKTSASVTCLSPIAKNTLPRTSRTNQQFCGVHEVKLMVGRVPWGREGADLVLRVSANSVQERPESMSPETPS